MDPTEILTKAWDAVRSSGVPEHLQEIAFREAIALLTSKKPHQRQEGLTKVEDPSNETDSHESPVDTDAKMQVFSDESGIDMSELLEVFFFDPDGTPHLNVSARKLGDSTAAKAKAIATAIAAAHFYAGDEPQVSVEAVRSEVTRLKSYDPKNFMNHLGTAAGVVLSGSGSTRVLRVKGGEMEAALRTIVASARRTRE